MRVSKAREILELNIAEAGNKMPPDVKKALELGVEALKRVQWQAQYPAYYGDPLLPGESNDNGGS